VAPVRYVRPSVKTERVYVTKPAVVSTPVRTKVVAAIPAQCTETPVVTCVPRQVETPKEVCQQVKDVHTDTVITETCEETITTVCSHTNTKTSSGIVDTSSTLVETGVPLHPLEVAGNARSSYSSSHHKREASGYSHGVSSTPNCSSTPVKSCTKTPKSTPRNVFRTVCDTLVDVTHIEDCTETVTKTCQSSSTSTSKHSKVVGHDTRVGDYSPSPSSVVNLRQS